MSAWTKGPWEAQVWQDPQWVVNVAGEWFNCIALTAQGNDAANARLIAAAPELAEALADVLSDITTDGEDWAEGTSVYRARAALRKARGEG